MRRSCKFDEARSGWLKENDVACRILVDRDNGHACFYCSVTEVAFGPIMVSAAWAEAFAEWLPLDPRSYDDVNDLIDKWGEFLMKSHGCKGTKGTYTCGQITMNATFCDDCEAAALEEVRENGPLNAEMRRANGTD